MKTVEIWDSYYSDIKYFIKSKINDEQIVDDLVQETFVKAHLNKEKLLDQAKVKPWLFTIAKNLIHDFFKKSIHHDSIIEEKVNAESDIDHVHTEKDCLHGLIKNLPQKYRDPLILSDIKGEKQEQIAKRLDIPLSTVKSQIQRGRKMIVKGYMDCCDYKLNAKGKLVGETKDKENCKICN